MLTQSEDRPRDTGGPVAAFKDEINAASVGRLSAVIEIGVPGFDGPAFRRGAACGLRSMELKARIAHVAHALGNALPPEFAATAPRVARAVGEAELSIWEAWPAVTWIEQAGLDQPEEALSALEAMTKRASAEFAIRPFLIAHPDQTWSRLASWTASPDHHVRRLVSEGTRPRLPWGMKVPALIERPERAIALLDRLREDDEEYVRRSVANHLNDVARDHPEVAVATAERWLAEDGEHVGAVVARGLRGLVKKGVPQALALTGADLDAAVDATLELTPGVAVIGGEVSLAATLTSRAPTQARVVVDYAVRYARPGGRASRKVFKLAVVELEPGEQRNLARRVSLVDRTIRTHHPGTHAVELLVNGRVAATQRFELAAA
jgi:3-methyladenine DNA glycosylase AlkC